MYANNSAKLLDLETITIADMLCLLPSHFDFHLQTA
jgi:hypothetical protein